MVFILFWSRILIDSIPYLRVDLVSNALEVVHRDQAEQRILTGHGLFLACACIHSNGTVSITLVCLLTRLWVNDEGGSEVTRSEIVITTGSRCLSTWCSDTITCTYLLISLIAYQLLLRLVGSYLLLWHHRVIGIIQVVQVIRDGTVLYSAASIVIYCLKLLFKVLMGHDIIIAT